MMPSEGPAQQLKCTFNELQRKLECFATGVSQWSCQAHRELRMTAQTTLARMLQHSHQMGRKRQRPLMLCCMSQQTPFLGFTATAQRQRAGRRKPNLLALISEANSKDSGKQNSSPTQNNAGPSGAENERILISEVGVSGVEGELKQQVEQSLTVKPNFSYTVQDIEADAHRIFDTGNFKLVDPLTEDTRDGVKLTWQVEPNPDIKGLLVTGANALPQRVVEDVFKPLLGRTMNHPRLAKAIGSLANWYNERKMAGEVLDIKETNGIIEVKVAETTLSDLNLRFIDKDSGNSKEEGSTRPEVILRYIQNLRPGQVVSMDKLNQDVESIYSTGLFKEVSYGTKYTDDSTPDAPKINLTLFLVEKKTGGLHAGGGLSGQPTDGAAPRFIGSLGYYNDNLFGLNQKLSTTFEAGQHDRMFRLSHTDPWVHGDPYRTSQNISVQNTRTPGSAIHGRATDEVAAGGEAEGGASGDIIVARMTGGIEFMRPLSTGWRGTLGVNWQRAKCLDEHNRALTQDVYGSPLTFSGGASDSMMLALVRAVHSGPGSQLAVSLEQALPLRPAWLNFNRFRLRAERVLPLGPRVRALAIAKGGAIVGDLPPYEAFPIGGTNSVRGYSEGGVGSGRNFASGTLELHFPLVDPVEGVIFGDYGSDINSGASVLGDPAGARGKPGSGYGYGAGVRVATPVGPLRLEYGWNDKGERRFHLAIGHG